jgi:hypothetical protein
MASPDAKIQINIVYEKQSKYDFDGFYIEVSHVFFFYAAVAFSTKREKPLLKMFEAFAVGKSYSSSVDAS